VVDEAGAHEGDNNPLVIYVCEITASAAYKVDR